MKRYLIFTVLAGATVAATFLFPNRTSGERSGVVKSPAGLQDRYIVVLNEGHFSSDASAIDVESFSRALTDVYGGNVRGVYSNVLKGFTAEMNSRQADQMASDPSVRFIEQDTVVSVATEQSNAPWHLDRADQRTLPLDSIYDSALSGAGVHVYVIDTGIRYTHEDFGGRANAVFDNIGDGQNGNDCHGHGTHVAGIIGSSTYGVAKDARLHAVRVLPCGGSGMLSDIVAGIDWLTANRINPAVANISISAAGISPAFDTAVSNSIGSGITYTIAAGNNAWDACSYSPARNPGALTVGATTNADVRAGYSNYGSCVDLFAPGHSITSLSHVSDSATRVMSGTSMAAPVVAGVAALYLGSNPGATPGVVEFALKNRATPNVVADAGEGSPDLLIYSRLTGPDPPPNPTPTPTPSPTPTPGPETSAVIRIIKQLDGTTGTSSAATFPYTAVNLSVASFSLSAANSMFEDPAVPVTGGQTVVSVTEEAVAGWRLASVSCSETGPGPSSVVNSTGDPVSRTATIIAEPGEQISCTFRSEPESPAASGWASGRVTDAQGYGLRGVRLILTDIGTGATRTATTSAFGYFEFSDLPSQNTYILTVQSGRRYTVESGPRTFTLLGNLAGLDFVVRPYR